MTEPAIPDAPVFGRSLTGFGVSLLVKDLAREILFMEQVLQAQVRFRTDKFGALHLKGRDLLLHSEETYRGNALHGLLQGGEAKGLGVELRVYGVDPDAAERRAREAGFTVLAGSMDKQGHGLRECVILDDEGFAWVPSVHMSGKAS